MSKSNLVFDRAKAFSDFVGFHVRLLFCFSVSQIAIAIPVSNLISSWQMGEQYNAGDYWLEISIVFVFAGYAFVLYIYIVRTGIEYINRLSPSSATGMLFFYISSFFFLILETGAIIAVLYFSALQILKLLDVDLQLAECVANDFLSNSNYPFTPETPAHCQ